MSLMKYYHNNKFTHLIEDFRKQTNGWRVQFIEIERGPDFSSAVFDEFNEVFIFRTTCKEKRKKKN